MSLSCAAALLLLFTTASAFGTVQPNYSVSRAHHSHTSSPAFVRGGSKHASKTQLQASTLDDTVVSTENLSLLSERGQRAILKLQNDEAQRHVVADWPPPGTEDKGKIRLAEQVRDYDISDSVCLCSYNKRSRSDLIILKLQLADLDDSYPGGLTAYLNKAKQLLKESADGTNPFSDYEALVPEGECLSFDQEGTMDFGEAEQLGLEGIGDVALVLVAGGLGERLGYSGIKLSLETNLCTTKSYLAFYIHYLQAMQYVAEQKTGRKDIKIPLAIMTSGDTDGPTRELLRDNDNFGLDDDQITIVMQDKVPALKDGSAGLALDDDDRWKVQTKPHGHGDVHHLLYREGLVRKWQKEGKKYVIFLQDTNALVINSIIPTLGVSMKKGFHMNSICIPRLAGEAAGAITRLE